MKKIFSLIAVVLVAFCAFAETEFTFTSAADLSQTKDGISVVLAKSSGDNAPKYNVTWNEEYQPSDMRLYAKNTITVSSTVSLTNIQLVFAKSCSSNSQYAGLTASTGTLTSGGVSESFSDWKVDSWTGSATTVSFTMGDKGQRQIQRILIDGAPIVIEPEQEAPLPTAADLNTSYVYAEPTNVLPQDTTILKKEYAFIDNNILVHCSQGSIVKEDLLTEGKEHPAYFNCNANYQITFTATQDIKGIAIDGFGRKDFNTTCDHGTIQFYTDEDYDVEAYPVLVIMNVNAKSVTLSCPKQIRCYELHVYFKGNPDPLYTGLESTLPSEFNIQKVLRDGQLIIIREGKEYTAQGTAL